MSQSAEERAYVRELEEFRGEKDEFFRRSQQSPIPFGERRDFSGLRYFPPNPALRVAATVEPLPEYEEVILTTSDGLQRSFQRYARLRFAVDEASVQLTAYLSPLHERQHGDHVHEEPLFIPFRDALAGTETYGAGRYLEVEGPEDGESTVTLDFNLAYNPYCAYNESYSCPIPPAENRLPVPIRAGERVYHEDEQ
jgi:uncharacterized protein (DUF1684 family)